MKQIYPKAKVIEKCLISSVYAKVENSQRFKLIQLVEKKGMKLVKAAKSLSINYQTAKSIFRTFKKENRILRKETSSIFQKNLKLNPPFKVYKDNRDLISANLMTFKIYNESNTCKMDYCAEFKRREIYQNLQNLNSDLNLVLSQMKENQVSLMQLSHLITLLFMNLFNLGKNSI
jgi:hypothetical protein